MKLYLDCIPCFMQQALRAGRLATSDKKKLKQILNETRENELQDIIDYWNMPNVEIIAAAQMRTSVESYSGDIETAIIETIARRPCILDDLHHFLGIHVNEINKYLGTLEANNKIKTVQLECGVFYTIMPKNLVFLKKILGIQRSFLPKACKALTLQSKIKLINLLVAAKSCAGN